jgi:two-component system, OmpR family, response regulator
VLLVEDNAEFAGRVARRIRGAGLLVDHVSTIEDASAALDFCSYSVTLLDRRLPDGDGLALVPYVRKMQPDSRILMLTALDAVDDRIEGLDAGADDYLTKPFSLDEMMARIRANLRKRPGEQTPAIAIGAISFDPDSRSVFISNRPIVLLRRELALLEVLVRRSDRVVPRETLIAAIYGLDGEVEEHTLTTLVSRLRTRLQEVDAGVEIHSARGLGYIIRASTTAKSARAK